MRSLQTIKAGAFAVLGIVSMIGIGFGARQVTAAVPHTSIYGTASVQGLQLKDYGDWRYRRNQDDNRNYRRDRDDDCDRDDYRGDRDDYRNNQWRRKDNRGFQFDLFFGNGRYGSRNDHDNYRHDRRDGGRHRDGDHDYDDWRNGRGDH